MSRCIHSFHFTLVDREVGSHWPRNYRLPGLPTSLTFSRADVEMQKQSPMLQWPEDGGAVWLAFGPFRNPWLRARHRRKYLQFPQPPPKSSLFHRCQDISTLHLPHGAQKNDTSNRRGGCKDASLSVRSHSVLSCHFAAGDCNLPASCAATSAVGDPISLTYFSSGPGRGGISGQGK